MRTKDLKDIPTNIDCEQTFKNANALLADGWEFVGLAGFKVHLKRHMSESETPLVMDFGADYTVSGKDEYMPVVKRTAGKQ